MKELAQVIGWLVLIYLAFAVPIWTAMLLWLKPWRDNPR